jgi:hypothetical protein
MKRKKKFNEGTRFPTHAALDKACNEKGLKFLNDATSKAKTKRGNSIKKKIGLGLRIKSPTLLGLEEWPE